MARKTRQLDDCSVVGFPLEYTKEGTQRVSNAFFEDLDWLIRTGAHHPLEQFLERLGTNWEALERRLYRLGRGDLVRKILAGDQRPYRYGCTVRSTNPELYRSKAVESHVHVRF